jgi:hypothetical protein
MLEHFPKRVAPVDREIAHLVGGLIRNGNQIEALRAAVSGSAQQIPGMATLLRTHRETETRLQLLIAGIERRHQY